MSGTDMIDNQGNASLTVLPRADESAAEREARMHSTLFLDVQRELLAKDDGRTPYDQLLPGDLIRHAGEWVGVRTLRGDGLMLVQFEDNRCEWVESAPGETWLRWSGGF